MELYRKFVKITKYYLRGGGNFLNLRLQNLSPIDYCSYSCFIGLNFFLIINNNVYYPIMKKINLIAADPPPQS